MTELPEFTSSVTRLKWEWTHDKKKQKKNILLHTAWYIYVSFHDFSSHQPVYTVGPMDTTNKLQNSYIKKRTGLFFKFITCKYGKNQK